MKYEVWWNSTNLYEVWWTFLLVLINQVWLNIRTSWGWTKQSLAQTKTGTGFYEIEYSLH